VLTLLAEAANAPSKTPFYIVGGLLVLWAVIVSFLGISRPDFPGAGERRGHIVMLITAVLVVGTMASAVVSS